MAGVSHWRLGIGHRRKPIRRHHVQRGPNIDALGSQALRARFCQVVSTRCSLGAQNQLDQHLACLEPTPIIVQRFDNHYSGRPCHSMFVLEFGAHVIDAPLLGPQDTSVLLILYRLHRDSQA
jgi:hypothetical protein